MQLLKTWTNWFVLRPTHLPSHNTCYRPPILLPHTKNAKAQPPSLPNTQHVTTHSRSLTMTCYGHDTWWSSHLMQHGYIGFGLVGSNVASSCVYVPSLVGGQSLVMFLSRLGGWAFNWLIRFIVIHLPILKLVIKRLGYLSRIFCYYKVRYANEFTVSVFSFIYANLV